MDDVARRLARVADSESPRDERARAVAEAIRDARGYRWIGIYDVGDEEIVLLAHTGAVSPAHTRFSIDQGLSGDAVRRRTTVVSNDVANDPRYLAAFENTGSETIVPVLGAESGIVIGTLDVESDRVDAFSRDDVAFLEECAAVLRPLYD
jgi:L-methionine (R)-S-oxide reductase